MSQNFKRVMWTILVITAALLFRSILEWALNTFGYQHDWTNTIDYIVRFMVTVIIVVVWVGIVVQTEYSSSKLPWLIVLAVEPFIGLGLFLTFGRSFRHSRRYKNAPHTQPGSYLSVEPTTNFADDCYREIDSEITDIYKAAFNSTKHHAYLNDTQVTVLKNGAMKFPKLIQELKNATSFILMEYYIIKTDEIGREVLDVLGYKAKQGLPVFLIYDALGSAFLDKSYMKELKKLGVKVIANDKVYFGLFNTRVNYRNHRKITVIDGTKGFVGGLNLADEYMNRKTKYGHFRDTHLFLEGAAVHSLTQLFFRDWYYNTKEFITDSVFYPETSIKTEGLVQVVPTGPEFRHPPVRNLYVKMINNAKDTIKIMTPYLALDQELVTSLIIAARSGVDVDIIIPGIPDKRSVYLVTRSFIEELVEEGIQVHVYDKGFTHAKILIIDNRLASCGTYNFDNRSARINFEVTTLLYKQGVSDLVQDFHNDMANSKEILYTEWIKRSWFFKIIEGIFNLFSPLV